MNHIRAGDLQETFEILWDFSSSIMRGWNSKPPDHSREFELETLEAWDRERMANVKTKAPKSPGDPIFYSTICTVTRSAYIAVETDFTDPEPEPNRNRLLDLLSRFRLDELRTMAVRIGAEHESIRGDTNTVYARELFAYAQRRNLLWRLVHVVMAFE
jgi:hypothetical protein